MPATIEVIDGAGNPQTINTAATLGQAVSAQSKPVVIASDQSTVPVSVSGVATAANQGTANTSLAAIATAQGTPADAALITPASSGSMIAWLKGILTQLNALVAGVVLAAGNNHIGQVGGVGVLVTQAPAVTASSAYASGNVVGSLMTFVGAARTGALSGFIQSVFANFKSSQTAPLDIVFFNANPTSSTFTDKSAIALNAADFAKVIGVAHITDFTSLGTPSVGQAQTLALPFALASGTTIYAVAVTRGTPTFGSTSDLSVGVQFLQD